MIGLIRWHWKFWKARRTLEQALAEAQAFIAEKKAHESPAETARWDERSKSMPAWREYADAYGVAAADKAFRIGSAGDSNG